MESALEIRVADGNKFIYGTSSSIKRVDTVSTTSQTRLEQVAKF